MSDDTLLTVRGLAASYGAIRALNGIDLDIPRGQATALLGPNGAGKSTLVRVLTGLMRPAAGSAALDGHELGGRSPERIAALGVSVVPEGRRVFPGMSVEDNLLSGGYRHRRDRAGTQGGLLRLYEMFPRLRERRTQAAGSLSGGEQQMVAVGRALMSRPQLLILDEPSLGLAPKVVSDLYASFAEIVATGTTMLVIEQNVGMAARVCASGYVLINGRIAAQAPSAQLREVAARSYLHAT